jgi:TatA/E family protein of Tat protein translocase
MFGLGIPELLLIFVIALLVFGPKKLPEMGKSIGRAMAEFKKASEDFQETVRTEMKEVEKSTGVEEVKKLANLDITAYEDPRTEKLAAEPDAEQKKIEKKDKQKKSGEADKNG